METLLGMPVSCGGNMVAPPAVVTAGNVAAVLAGVVPCGMATNCICRPSLDNLMVADSTVAGVVVAGVC